MDLQAKSLSRIRFLFALALVASNGSGPAFASTHELPAPSLAAELLSESVPSAAAPADDFSIRDFTVEWQGTPLTDVQFSLGAQSLEWVRVSDVLVLPRARLVLRATDFEVGQVTHAGFTQPFLTAPLRVDFPGKKILNAAVPIALISGEANPIEVQLKRGTVIFRGKLLIHYKPQGISTRARVTRVFLDSSCSNFRVQVQVNPFNLQTPVAPAVAVTIPSPSSTSLTLPLPLPAPLPSPALAKAALASSPVPEATATPTWAYVGCRLTNTQGSSYRTSSLETYVYWDGVGERISLNGLELSSVKSSLWTLRLRSSREPVLLRSIDSTTPVVSAEELKLTYTIPEQVKYGSLGVGVGPYTYVLEAPGTSVHMIAPILTLYASYFLTETSRIVAFDETVAHSVFYTDLGIYLHSESVRAFDQRIRVSLMLGAHTVGFKANNRINFKFSAPQGFEILLKDAFQKGYNFTVGSFLYPSISGSSYYNLWTRWGTGGYFGEVNYISLQDTLGGLRVYSRSFGISAGFPLFRFF